MTTATFNPDVDGTVAGQSAVYSTARSTGSAASSATSPASAGQGWNGATFSCYEAPLSFPTGATLPDDAVIDDAFLDLYITVLGVVNAWVAEIWERDFGTTIEVADFVSGANLGTNPSNRLATLASGSMTVNAHNVFVSDATFKAAISKTGNTRILIASSRHRTGNAPSLGTNSELISFVSLEGATQSQRPLLTVVYHMERTGTATGSMSLSGTASGARGRVGTALGSIGLAATASGVRGRVGAAAGSMSLAGAAGGTIGTIGTATGALSLTGTAQGTRATSGAAAGSILLTGTAVGVRDGEGAALGSISLAGTASGVTARSGAATGSIALAGAANGSRVVVGTALGSVALTGTALGNPRDVTITAGIASSSWTASVAPSWTAEVIA